MNVSWWRARMLFAPDGAGGGGAGGGEGAGGAGAGGAGAGAGAGQGQGQGQGSGAGAGAGAGAGQGQGAEQGAGQGAGQGQGAGNQGGEAPWYGNPAHKGLIENKGFRNVEDVITWGTNLEKLIGRDKLVLPKDSTDTEGWNRVYDALGRPKDPKEYQLPVPDGMDRGFADKFAAKFHARGLTVDQARGVAEDWNGMVSEMAAADNARFAAKSKADVEGVYKELGNDQAGAFFNQVNMAAQALGVTKTEIKSLERALGTRRMLDLMHKMGDGLSEDTAAGDGQGGGQLTPEAARARVKELQGDAAWRKKFQEGDAGVRAEMDRLNRIIAGY